MIVERLDVENVRNIESARLALDPGVNLIVGPNGAGKTALLETLHLLIRGRSFRTNRPEAIIRHHQDRMGIGAGCQDAGLGSLRLSHVRQRSGQVELRRDGRLVRQVSSVAALLPIQLLLPDLADLVFGAPAGRRQWLDWGVFHVKHDHIDNLRDYLRALRHRNAVLRTGDRQTLAAWTARVAELGEVVAAARRAYFERAEPRVRECVAALSPGLVPCFSYFAGWRGENLAETLGQQLDRDVQSGATHSGPHRADVGINHGSDSAAQVLSRGQGKVVASALRLGQARDLMDAGKQSLFLIDDVGAELDRTHNERFHGLLADMRCQVVATTAHAAWAEPLTRSRRGRMFHVEQGRLRNTT